MIKRNNVKPAKRHSRRWPTFVLIVACGLMLVTGLFFAGRQHFSSMDFGMKNSRLRKQIDDLQAEKRRLLLKREVALSPSEIKKAAMKVWLADPMTAQPELAKASATSKAKATPALATDLQPKPMIIKTVSVKPAKSTSTPVLAKCEIPAKPVKRVTAAAE